MVPLRLRRHLVLPLVAGALVLAAGVAVPGLNVVHLLVPTSLHGTSSPGDLTGSAGAAAIRVVPDALALGPAAPGEHTDPVLLTVTNLGVGPLRVRVTPGPMLDPATGAALPAERVAVGAPPGSAAPAEPGVALVPAGGLAAFEVRLHVPWGGAQWVPAGDYVGAIAVTAEGAL